MKKTVRIQLLNFAVTTNTCSFRKVAHMYMIEQMFVFKLLEGIRTI